MKNIEEYMINNGIPSWVEWSKDLSPAQREYALYTTLKRLNDRMTASEQASGLRLETCQAHFALLDKRQWVDRSANIIGGIVGGYAAVLSIILFKWEVVKDFLTSGV